MEYLRGQKIVKPIVGHDFGPTEEVDRVCIDLQQHCTNITPRKFEDQPDWISDNTWNYLQEKAC
jgi:hypothetical protein